MQKILFILGTRPEAIKMAPCIKVFKDSQLFEVKVCVTAQHRNMLDQVLPFFSITPDYDLNLMEPSQNLFDISASGIKALEKVLDHFRPSITFVQGDTTSAFIGALAGFYKQTKVAHIEAGLRSENKYSPFPEEMNRRLAGHIADFHFAPTIKSVENLRNEGITTNVWHVGNTVIDTLFWGLDLMKSEKEDGYKNFFSAIDFSRKIILVTGHRRESFGKPFENICLALKDLVNKFDDIEIAYPVHLNPKVQEPVNRILGNIERVHLIEPVSYPYFIWLMNKSYLVLTDSGGIQEEAPSLAKPVLVMREVTERIEGIKANTAKLVGTNQEKIVKEASELLENKILYKKMAKADNPYGDGTTSAKIFEIICEVYGISV